MKPSRENCARCGGQMDRESTHPRRPARQSYCKACHAEYMRSWRSRYAELTSVQRLKHNARAYAKVYLKRGKLKPQPCEVCRSTNVEMHHDDYTKPLEVRWFCRKHHLQLERIWRDLRKGK